MESYYLEQAGNGTGAIQSYGGVRYQRGGGFFSRLFSSKVLPILRYLGDKALVTGKAILDDFKTSASDRIMNTVQDVAQDVIKRKRPASEESNQSGSGIKRRKLSKRSYLSNFDFLK